MNYEHRNWRIRVSLFWRSDTACRSLSKCFAQWQNSEFIAESSNICQSKRVHIRALTKSRDSHKGRPKIGLMIESFERINSMRETNGNFGSCNSCKRLGMSCTSQNFRLFHGSNLSVRNFRIFLLMHTVSLPRHPTPLLVRLLWSTGVAAAWLLRAHRSALQLNIENDLHRCNRKFTKSRQFGQHSNSAQLLHGLRGYLRASIANSDSWRVLHTTQCAHS